MKYTDGFRDAFVAFVISGGCSYAFALWLWPLVGPYMFDPCPKFLGWGVAYWTFRGFCTGWGSLYKTFKEKRLEERLQTLEGGKLTAAELTALAKAFRVRT